MLGAMEIFKYLPASKKLPESNCKKCGCPTCMAFALKLSKKQVDYSLCPNIPDELVNKIIDANKIQQKEIVIDGRKFGGEKVMFRHQKTFLNPTGFFIKLDCNDKEFDKKYSEIKNFELEIIGNKYKIDGIYLLNFKDEIALRIKSDGFSVIDETMLDNFISYKYSNFSTLKDFTDELTYVRRSAIIDKNPDYSNPILTFLDINSPLDICTIGSALICKYASIIVFDCFNKAIMSSLMVLRLNIYTDPEKPLKVDSKVYEFNNPDENSLVFMTTNFALTYFAVSNELSSLKRSAYLVVTPSEGMSVLTAWSAEKITAEIVKNMVENSEVLSKIKNKKLIIPGHLVDLKEELELAIPEWEIVIGTKEAYKIPQSVENYNW